MEFIKDTSICRPQEPGIEPPTFWLVDDPLYLPPAKLMTFASVQLDFVFIAY